MKTCKHCGAEIEDDSKFCPECGELVESADRELEWVLLKTAENQFEADILKNLLEANGVVCLLKRPGTGFDISNPYANPILGHWGRWNVFVMKIDLERAEEIIKSMEDVDGNYENDDERSK